MWNRKYESLWHTRVNMTKQCVTASLFAQQELFSDVTRSGNRDDF